MDSDASSGKVCAESSGHIRNSLSGRGLHDGGRLLRVGGKDDRVRCADGKGGVIRIDLRVHYACGCIFIAYDPFDFLKKFELNHSTS